MIEANARFNFRFTTFGLMRQDFYFAIAADCLFFQANCSKLVKFILNDAGDEYDYEDRYFGITGKGIANLIISLPRLKLLICEPYLLREAIR